MHDCIFCNKYWEEPTQSLIPPANPYFDRWRAYFDAYPVTKGHILIVPVTHVYNYFDLTHQQKHELIDVIDMIKSTSDKLYKPGGYNIGWNCGPTAGQTVCHFHCHVIPRYVGDCADPKGGVRGVIPSRQKY